jgi:hypothetical protein
MLTVQQPIGATKMTVLNETNHTAVQVPRLRRGVMLYEENPFIVDAAVNSKPGVKRISNTHGDKMMIVNEGTGEVVAGAGFWQIQEVDRTQFVKLYVNGVRAFKELSGAGTKVFELMYLEIQKQIGKDKIYLTFRGIDQDVTPISETSYQRGLKELISKGFLAPCVLQGWYFINPDYVFNGDRLAFVKEFRKAATKPTARVEDRDTKTIDMFAAGEPK